jgi:hypothetical protein
LQIALRNFFFTSPEISFFVESLLCP